MSALFAEQVNSALDSHNHFLQNKENQAKVGTEQGGTPGESPSDWAFILSVPHH